MSKSEVESGRAERNAEHYLRLNQKQRVMDDALSRDRRLVLEPPFPSLSQALRDLTVEANFSVTQEEAQAFVTDAKPEPASVNVPLQATASATQQQAERSISAAPQSGTGQPAYISSYREMLKSAETIPSRMLRFIANAEVLTWGELKKAVVGELDYKSENSGSISVSLKVPQVDGYVTIDGSGDGKRIRSVQKAR